MTKVWEETWSGGFGDEPDVSSRDGVYALFDSHGDADNIETDIARARLAACAPAMVRMLLELSAFACPVCERTTGEGDVHRSDCTLDALMKRAGVR